MWLLISKLIQLFERTILIPSLLFGTILILILGLHRLRIEYMYDNL